MTRSPQLARSTVWSMTCLALLWASLLAGPAPAQDLAAERRAMVDEIRAEAEGGLFRAGTGPMAPEVLRAMGEVPRHELVPERLRNRAYLNRPLPIGYGQTISQPYIVAFMTDLLEPEEGDVMLEVGTGSGYQAAVLAELVDRVDSIEIIPELAERARRDLRRLGYDNVTVKQGDGYYGWEEHAPYDGIVVAAAASHIPPALVQQLKPGARLVIPVGGAFATQQLTLVEKTSDGKVKTRQLLPVSFVPLTGEH